MSPGTRHHSPYLRLVQGGMCAGALVKGTWAMPVCNPLKQAFLLASLLQLETDDVIIGAHTNLGFPKQKPTAQVNK